MSLPSREPYAFEGSGERYSLRDLLNVVFRRRILIMVFAASVFALALVFTLSAKQSYLVTATLLVNKARAEVPLAPTESAQLIISQLSEQDLNSEIEILKSRSLIEEVLKNLEVDESMRPKIGVVGAVKGVVKRLLGRPDLSYFDVLVLHLQEKLEITPIRKSNVIRVAYRSQDPEWAHRVVETLIERYLDRRAQMYQSPQAVEFFERQMEAAEERLRADELSLEQYVDNASITMVRGPQGTDSLAAQKALIMQRLATLEGDLGDAEVEYQAKLREATSLRERLEREPDRIASSNRLNQDAASEEIERALAALRLERDRLLQDFKPDSRFVRDVETQIALAEQRLAEIRSSVGVGGTEMNPVHQQLKSELLRVEAGLEGTSARVVSLSRQVVEERLRLEDLNGRAFKLENLSRQAQVSEEDYLLYRKKFEEARISAAMDQQKLINVAVAQPAQVPLKPESQGMLMRLLAGLAFGVFGGMGLAFAIEFHIDRSFSTGEDVERGLGIPHLASIPDSSRMG